MTTETPRLARTLRLVAPLTAALGLAAAIAFAPAAEAQTYTFSTLATFTRTANGAYPYASVALDSSGNLYGTTANGGANDDGTVFKVAAGTNTLSTLATFTGTANGATPLAGLTLDSSGNLYGMTYGGGTSNGGTVFKIVAGTNTVTTLANFNGANGEFPIGGITLDSGGNLYGTTETGGANDDGTVFKVAAGTNTVTTLATFTGNANGANPTAGLAIDSGGNLYGTTYGGGASNDGTVFKVAAGTNTLTTLATFNNTNGENPHGGVVFDSSGNLYGTTETGGASNDGTVFKIAAGTNTFSTLATFTGTANGANPYAGLALDSSGNLYGTTYGGGLSSDGTVFKIAAGTNTVTTLANFTGTANGAGPIGITLDSSANIYGATNSGGASNDGTVFKLTVSSGAAPEPGTLALIASALLPIAGLGVRRRYRGTTKCPPRILPMQDSPCYSPASDGQDMCRL